jgi:hypothetical protein
MNRNRLLSATIALQRLRLAGGFGRAPRNSDGNQL